MTPDPLEVLRKALAEVEQQAARYKEAIRVLSSTEQLPLPLTNRQSSPQTSATRPVQRKFAFRKPQSETKIGAATQVLREAGHPMHIKQITAAIQQLDSSRALKSKSEIMNLLRTLNRLSEKGRRFRRVGPSTFMYVQPTAGGKD